jgi:hypothetical protein
MKLSIILSINDTYPSKDMGVGLRPERFIDKPPIRGGSTNKAKSCDFFLSNAKHRWSKATSTRLVANAYKVKVDLKRRRSDDRKANG